MNYITLKIYIKRQLGYHVHTWGKWGERNETWQFRYCKTCNRCQIRELL